MGCGWEGRGEERRTYLEVLEELTDQALAFAAEA